jgi:8-oxo-dGTP pyrophosphatase MutT (NUDIX family)
MIIEDKSYGVIVVFENKFLILRQAIGHWGFPKGHIEKGETEKEGALRELKEEAGTTECILTDLPPISEEYTFQQDGEKYHKIVQYFIGSVKDDKVTIQQEEITDYKWATYEEALKILTYDNTKEVIKKAKEHLDKLDMVK